jgi:hypothetical protein
LPTIPCKGKDLIELNGARWPFLFDFGLPYPIEAQTVPGWKHLPVCGLPWLEDVPLHRALNNLNAVLLYGLEVLLEYAAILANKINSL